MKQSILASLALLGTRALASSVGSALVINSCAYEVYLFNVPAKDGGYNEEDAVLQPGQTWSQDWTKLENAQGWAIKLAKSTDMSNILQYEYTYHDDGSIWYDLSAVNGNPWDKDWEIYSDGITCTPKHSWYRNSSDDEFGEQWCPDTASITVSLCSGEGSGTAPSSSAAGPSSYAAATVQSVAAPSPQTTAIAQTTPIAPTSAPWTPSSHTHANNHLDQAANQEETETASPTTFATSTTAAVEEAPGVTIWEVETAVATDIVTVFHTAPSRVKRHEHHAGHQHAF